MDGETVQPVDGLVSNNTAAAGATSFVFDLNAPEGGFNAGVVYRVQYQTCTPDGEVADAGTVFTNQAEIEGWGEDGIGIGEAEALPWHMKTSKSGKVLGGADRDDKLAWTIQVPGKNLNGANNFSFIDTLGDGHALNADTLSGLRVYEQYGPSGERFREITTELNRTNVTSDSDYFGMTLTWKDAGKTFQGSDWRYIITYVTDVISGDLPIGGKKYGNSVKINKDPETSGEAKVDDREYKKKGNLNKDSRTLDGVEHSAFTTLDWTVTIPGERLYDEHGNALSKIDLIDTLGATHQVCEVGEPTQGVKERLGLSVKVKDQIEGGGRNPATDDLTSVTSATVAGQDITFTITQPSGEKFNRDYQYVIQYTTCTTSGGIDAKNTEYTNKIEGSGIDQSGRTTMNYSGSGTGTGVAKGSVGIAKKVTGPGAPFVRDGTHFTVRVEEFAPGKTEAETSYDLTVPLNSAEPVKGKFQRGTGWTMRITEPRITDVAGVVFGTPKFTASTGVTVNETGDVAIATITPKTNIAVELTNTAELGQMSVTKVLEGAAANEVDPNKVYGFHATIDTPVGVPDENPRAFELMAGGVHTLTNLPIGSVVTVSEVKPNNDDRFTWADPVVSPNPVTITADNVTTPAAVTVTNSVTRSVGTFSLNKTIEGAQKENRAVPSEVTVTATWQQEGETEPTSKTLTLPTDGTLVAFGEQLLIGTKVTLTETPLVDGSSIAWSAPSWSGSNVVAGDNNTAIMTISRDAAAQVNLTNHAATSTAGISLLKVVTGEAAEDVAADAEFPVTATWTDAENQPQSVELMINANEPTPLGVDLPAGTVVTITEGERPAFDTVVWGSIAISGKGVTDSGDGAAEIVVSDQQGAVTLVSVTNEATWAEGTFSLTKQVEGVLLDDAEVPEAVDVVATWYVTENSELVLKSETISVPTDGSAVGFSRTLPAFTEVTLTEAKSQNPTGARWEAAKWESADDRVELSSDGRTAKLIVIGENEAPLALALTNDYAKVEALSVTGADLGGIAAAAVVLAGLGGAALMLSRRKARAL